MGPSTPNYQKVQLRTSLFYLHLGRTDSQLDVQKSRPDRAEGPLYVQESRPDRAEGPLCVQGGKSFLAQILASTDSYPNAKSIHILGP